MQQGTQSYPDRIALQQKLDSLYGALLSMNGTKKGNNHIMTIRLETANQKFISNEAAIMDEAITLFNEVIFNPKREHGIFPQSIVDREKETLKQKINGVADDKMRLANMRILDEMCKDERYKLHIQGYEEDLETITPDDLYACYQSMLEEDELDIYVSGDIDPDKIEDKLSAVFTRKDVNNRLPHEEEPVDQHKEVRTIIEKQDVQQAKLHFGYRTHISFQNDDYFALHVFNGLFGGFPSSKLFINVREKNSLAYYAASRFESHKGLLFVFSGIAPNDYEQAREIIEEQMQAMKNGDFTENELADTKQLIINQLLETMDSARGMVELMYQQVVGCAERPPEKLIEGIKSVSKEDVIRVAEKLELDTVYLLTRGDMDE
ncbi:EF-P 5-aminopentanol modification-associated protein YfmF [Lentibacillus amyloliquefaciens]|uniref:EF-P 5-aminopentanol modification-associated protein YfmF n=1 Tax=Lentibacillus amyloliquefaciens TaxID=1472767 RepID=UPI002FF8BC7D